MNFLEYFPPEIIEIIFQFLNVEDIIKLSEVSRSLYNYIANDKFMKRITIIIDKKRASLKCLQYILNTSARQYQHIKITQFSHLILPILKTLPISTLTICEIDFSSIGDFFALMKHSSSVREINLEKVYILSMEQTHQEFQVSFEHLKILNLNCCHAIIYDKIFKNCTKLEKFSIKAGSEISLTSENAVKKILTNNPNLRVLGIHFNIFGLLFASDFINIPHFKLRVFHASNLNQSFTLLRSNFHNFLLTHFETLEEVSIDNWMGVDVMKLIFLMPYLKKLTLKGFHQCECEMIDWDTFHLQTSQTIEELCFHDISANFDTFKSVINSCKNVKKCKFYSLNKEMINHLASICLQLESVIVENLFVISSDYPLKNSIKVSKKC